MFHTIANWHNKITLNAGSSRELLKDRPLDTLTKEELRKEHEKLVALLDKIESDAVTANQKVMELKDALYKKLKPEEPL
jgi:hypothetical protein